MRHANRRDANEKDIVDYLEAYGASVFDLTRAGRGIPDKLVGFEGITELAEIKRPLSKTGKEAGSKWTKSQKAWGRKWRGRPIWLIRHIDDAARMLEDMHGRALRGDAAFLPSSPRASEPPAPSST